MNWEAIGAVGELVGAGAVIASLLYVAAQVRHNSNELRSASADAAVSSIQAWLSPVLTSPDTWDVFWRGSEDIGQLDEKEVPRFIAIAFSFLKTVETLHHKSDLGALDPVLWKGWSAVLHRFAVQPGMRAYWEHRRGTFTPAFWEWLNSPSTEGSHDVTPVVELARILGDPASPSL